MSQQTAPIKTLSREAIQKFADDLGVEYCAIKAVLDVETGGKPFLADGRPLILFEGHIFYKELKKAGIDPEPLIAANKDILYKSWTKQYYKGGAGEYDRLQRAIAIHREAALRSASWGLFQIMGFNCELCGESDIESFVQKQYGISEQLVLAAMFLRMAGHVPALKNKDWAVFARRYNGPAYADNQYDIKLRKAYEKCGVQS